MYVTSPAQAWFGPRCVPSAERGESQRLRGGGRVTSREMEGRKTRTGRHERQKRTERWRDSGLSGEAFAAEPWTKPATLAERIELVEPNALHYIGQARRPRGLPARLRRGFEWLLPRSAHSARRLPTSRHSHLRGRAWVCVDVSQTTAHQHRQTFWSSTCTFPR
jgi:hypothetical protein